MKNIHAKLFTFGLLTAVFVVAFLANQIASATDWHFGGYATATAVASPSAVATIAFANQGAGTTSAIVTIPASTQANDYLLCAESNGGNVNPNWPNGWHPLTTPNNGFSSGNRYNSYAHCVQPGEPGATITLTNTDVTLVMCCAAYRHVGCSADNGGSTTVGTQASNNHPQAAGLTTTIANDYVAHMYGWTNNQNASAVQPGGDTLRATVASASSSKNGCLLSDAVVASPTSVPSAQASASASIDASAGNAMAVIPVTP